MKKKIRVGAVSYLNTKPLIYGFEHGMMHDEIELQLEYPSKLAVLMQKNKLDIALLPIASIPNIIDARVFSNYCICSNQKVASVCLFSHVPIEEVQEVYMDYQSRTSVVLFRILMRDFWNIRPSLLDADDQYINKIKGKTAGIIIGDRALEQINQFPFVYDLAEAWKSHTSLPFVFATWVTNQDLPESFIHSFNQANAKGLESLDEIILSQPYNHYDLRKYYTENISYVLDDEKKKGMHLFLKMLPTL
jgi:chorismate dehydratase